MTKNQTNFNFSYVTWFNLQIPISYFQSFIFIGKSFARHLWTLMNETLS